MEKNAQLNLNKIKEISSDEQYKLTLNELENIENIKQKSILYLELGRVEVYRRNFLNAVFCFEEAQKYFQQQNDIENIAICLSEMAFAQYKNNNERLLRSLSLLNDAYYLVENIDNATRAKTKINYNYGLIYFNEKRFSEAVKYFKTAQEYSDKNSLEYAQILDNFAIYYLKTNNYQIANRYLENSLKLKRFLKAEREIVLTEIILIRHHQRLENYEEALPLLLDAYNIATKYNDSNTLGRILDEIAKNHIYFKKFEKAQSFIEKSLKTAVEAKNDTLYAYNLCTKAILCIELEQTENAKNSIKESDNIFSKNYNKRGKALIKKLEAIILNKEKNYNKAIEIMHEALELYRIAGDSFEVTKCYFNLSLFYKEMGDYQMAISSAMEALRNTNYNEYPVLTKQVEDLLFELDENEWCNLINKTAKKEKLFTETKSLLEALDIIGNISESNFNNKDPLLALLRIGRSIAAETDLDNLLEIIAEETKKVLNADRCTVFLVDKEKKELWSKVALGMGSQEIRFPANKGLAGHVAQTGQTINIKDAYNDSRFNKDIDQKTGYKTKTILCMPMRNLNHEITGVFQVLNKLDGPFNDEDEDLLVAIGSSAGIALENANLLKKQIAMYEEQKKSFTSFINTLAASIDAKDKITSGHSRRVTGYAVAVAKQMNMEKEEVEAIECAALLHDFGKIGIKDNILCKEGKLTPDEYAHIQEHAFITNEILKNMFFEEKFKDVPEIASSHHEKYDGSGYFRKLKGTEIPLGGRILAVADVFDAITSKRHYRERMPVIKALEVIKTSAGTHFDPTIVDSFFNINVYEILNVLVAEEINLNDKEKEYFNKITLGKFYSILNKKNLTDADKILISNFEKFYNTNRDNKQC